MKNKIHPDVRKKSLHKKPESQLTAKFIVIDLLYDPLAETSVEPLEEAITELAELPSDFKTNDDYKTTKMVLKKIEKGIFSMGSPPDETGREPYGEGSETLHKVNLRKNYYMAIFQCTQAQYKIVTGYNPNEQKFEKGAIPKNYVGDKLPVGNISWYTARGGTWPGGNPDPSAVMGKLQFKTKRKFDLPPEAQWEYACRAGTRKAYNNDTDCLVEKLEVYEQEINADVRDRNLDLIANYRFNTYCLDKGPQEVGSKDHNNWGLYDMHGNIWEWCLDLYKDYDETTDTPIPDPVGASLESGSVYRVKRGGAGNSQPHRCRSANRSHRDPSDLFTAVGWGFRVILTAD